MSMRNQRFLAAPLVQVVTTKDGGAVLLDLQTDRFLGLDPMGMLMWTLFTTGHTPQEVLCLIAERYTIESEEVLQEDIFRLLQHMEAQRLLLPVHNLCEKHDGAPAHVKWSSFGSFHTHILPHLSQIIATFHLSEWLEAWLLLQWVHTFLVHGKLIDLARKLHALPTKYLVTYEHPDVRHLAELVQSAAAWQPFKAVCLHQNLTLGFLLRRRALHADLAIGVATFPFFAHAWLRSGSEVIHWRVGLGPGASQERLHELPIIFCTEWLSDRDSGEGRKP